MRRVGVVDARAFVALLAQDGPVFDDLMADVTVGETYFFRESAQFAALRETIIPDLRARHGLGERVRTWSAGCSTGEEPYSLAITFAEANVDAYVVGTDVSRERLAAARRGLYRQWSFRGVSQPVIERYFKHASGAYQLAPDVRRAVEFRYLNLASDRYPDLSSGVWGMDLIFCRNVLIYLDRETIARVATSLIASLAEGGWIVLGSTDPPLSDFVKCEVVKTPAGLVYRRASTDATTAVFEAPQQQVLRPLRSQGSHTDFRHHTVAPSDPSSVRQADAAPSDVKSSGASASPALPQATAQERAQEVRTLANAGRLAEAGRACAAALDEHRENCELHYLHAILLAEAGHFAESARAAKRALYLERDMVVAHLALGSALLRDGDHAGARRSLSNAERLLSAMSADAIVPYTDGELAGRLLEMTRVQSKLAGNPRAA
jgi:chemotaxis protein methyltransferase CheR